MATFVLVHGAWVGSFYWRPITQVLRKAGHEVYTPTLTGLANLAAGPPADQADLNRARLLRDVDIL